jgi:ribosomal protein S19
MYKFKQINKNDVRYLCYERNSNIPRIFLKFRRFYLDNGKKLRYIKLNKYKVGSRFGYYLLTRSLTKLKKKKKKKR